MGDRAGRTIARFDGTCGVARKREELAGIFRTAMLRLPSFADGARTKLAPGARLPRPPPWRSAVERVAVCSLPRTRASSGQRYSDSARRAGRAAGQVAQPTEPRPRRGRRRVGQRGHALESTRGADRVAAL